eukprot:scpid99614/ scgid25240/ 
MPFAVGTSSGEVGAVGVNLFRLGILPKVMLLVSIRPPGARLLPLTGRWLMYVGERVGEPSELAEADANFCFLLLLGETALLPPPSLPLPLLNRFRARVDNLWRAVGGGVRVSASYLLTTPADNASGRLILILSGSAEVILSRLTCSPLGGDKLLCKWSVCTTTQRGISASSDYHRLSIPYFPDYK